MELTIDLPYQVTYFPKGEAFASAREGHPVFHFEAAYDFIAIAMPARLPSAEAPLGLADLKVLEGMNDQGLTFSLLSYPSASGKQKAVEMTQAVLSASDLGSWALSQFASVAALKDAIATQPIMLDPLAILGGVESPFHYVVHDATGAGLILEFDGGTLNIYDNPVGVMTNGPAFSWHLTNLDNYTFLDNVDRPSATFGTLKVRQPDSGIATAGLPSSNTSVGRFVRAVYYAQFTEKAATPDLAVQTLGHVMNNFDRPRGASIDYPGADDGHLEVPGLAEDASAPYATEFTSWTVLADLGRKVFYVRDYKSLNFARFDLTALAAADGPRVVPLAHLMGDGNGTDHLMAARAA
ncbi:linear amide C-N hydrolase [Acuticoccus sp. M5D2P5]|nr:linear amide C-N hydrolase [Acuticoccus kalidii]